MALLLLSTSSAFAVSLIGLACEAGGIDTWLAPCRCKGGLYSLMWLGREAPSRDAGCRFRRATFLATYDNLLHRSSANRAWRHGKGGETSHFNPRFQPRRSRNVRVADTVR